MLDDAGERIAISLNIAADKVGAPVMDPAPLTEALMNDRLQPFDKVLARLVGNDPALLCAAESDDPLLLQSLHMALIEARMRIKHLEGELAAAR